MIKEKSSIDSLSLDTRTFDPTWDEIAQVCAFFGIGKLKNFENEKGISISHSNFFVCAQTSQGSYALKFYPSHAAKAIQKEYAINRLLIHHHFPTPLMHAREGKKPFFKIRHLLATCYDYINGRPAFQMRTKKGVFPKINTTLLTLNHILADRKQSFFITGQNDFIASIQKLSMHSKSLATYDKKDLVHESMQKACQTYQDHQALFQRQKLHTNASLSNFLYYKDTIFTLDLSHIQEDTILSDLAHLVISCLFFEMPLKSIKPIVKDYFHQDQINVQYSPVLHTLLSIGLIKEYLKNIQREKSLVVSTHPPPLTRRYAKHLEERKRYIMAVLQKLNKTPRLLV